MRNCFVYAICLILGAFLLETFVPPSRVQAASVVSGPYIMAFHACDSAITDCTNPQNHNVYLAQSSNGTSWAIVPGWKPFAGSVPDVVQRGTVLYVYTASDQMARYHMDTGILDPPVSVSVPGLQGGFVDPSLILDDQSRITLFFMPGTPGGDPAQCSSGVSSCTKHFQSATEVEGSDGTQFTLDSGDRASVVISTSGTPRTASDPAVFYDGHQYVLYITYGSSMSVWTSPTLRGSYTLVQSPPGGMLNNNNGGAGSGYYDIISQSYWTYAHSRLNSGTTIIQRAVHADFSRQLTNNDWKTVLTPGDVGFSSTTSVQSPGFHSISYSTVYFPQVAVGGGYTTIFTITNTGSTAASGTVTLTDQQAKAFLVNGTLTDSTGTTQPTTTGSSFLFTVPSGGTIFLSVTTSNSIKVGWAEIDSTGGTLTAVATYDYTVGSVVQSIVGVLQTQPLQYMTFPVNNESAKQLDTVYAIANPTNGTIYVKLALVAQDGTVVDDITVPLNPWTQIATYLKQSFSGRNDFKGSLVLRGQNGAMFVAVALNYKQNLLTVIPLISGKASGIPN